MKKFLCILLFVATLISLSACGKGSSTLVKHYGQEKVDEMEIQCTDEAQLKIADSLVDKAREILSFLLIDNWELSCYF